jgi:hypothetical protein
MPAEIFDNSNERKEWSKLVLEQMKKKEIDFNNDHFVILTGLNYRKYLVEHLSHYELPLEGKQIGSNYPILKEW